MKYAPKLHKLSNGITVILDPMDLETVSIKVLFNTGSRDELPHEYGLTHFCEHMLCKGTTRFPTQKDVSEFLDYNGGTKNAGTGNHFLAFYGRILAENINLLIDVFADQLQNSLFEPDKIEIERRVILDELRRFQDNRGRQYGTFISEKLFNWATFSERALGTPETIASFTREQMLEFLGRRLSARNCIIGISGKINDADDVLRHLENAFAFLPQFDVPVNDAITYTPQIAHKYKADVSNIRMSIVFPDIRDTWPQTYENIFQNKCVYNFERHMNQELYEIVRRKNGLTYGFSKERYGNDKLSVVGFHTQTSAENIAEVVALIAKNAYKIYTEKTITDDDLKRFVCKNRFGDANWLESSTERCDHLIGFYRDYGRVYDFYEDVKMSESIRRDDVIKYSRGYFDGPMSIITFGPEFDADLAAIWHENFK